MTEEQPRLYCPKCKKGNQSPCEKCNYCWEYKDGIIPVDDSFEIISEKEKYWRDQLVAAETSHITAEANMTIADKVIQLAKAEIAKEAKKNAD